MIKKNYCKIKNRLIITIISMLSKRFIKWYKNKLVNYIIFNISFIISCFIIFLILYSYISRILSLLLWMKNDKTHIYLFEYNVFSTWIIDYNLQ